MSVETVLEVGRDALWTTMLVASPMLLVGLTVGLLVSIFQSATQINEMTMTFVPKIAAVLLTLLLALPWVLGRLTEFTERIFERLLSMGVA